MLKVLAVTENDFEKTYPLLATMPSSKIIPKETWRRLFLRQWTDQTEPLGYILVDKEEVVGYVGLLSVQRNINGQQSEIVDITSWIAKEEYGGHAIKLVYPFIRDQNKTVISFTPAKNIDRIFGRFGLRPLNARWQIIPFWSLALGSQDIQIIFDIEGHRSLLKKEDRQIYSDHRKFSAEHFIIKKGQSYCYVAAQRILKKKLPFLHVHYVSDKKQFAQAIPKCAAMICWRLKTWGLIVFENYLGEEKIPGVIKINMPWKSLFRSPNLKPEDIDSLYSEYFVLNF